MTVIAEQSELTLSDQVNWLHDIIAGYHATNLIEIGRELGVWKNLTEMPGLTSAGLAARLGTDRFATDVLCRTAFALELLERTGDGWRMAPHFDQLLGRPDSTFYLGHSARANLLVGQDYAAYVGRIRSGAVVSYASRGADFVRELGESTATLPRVFFELVLPRLPFLGRRLAGGARILDVGCGIGVAVVEFAERYPGATVVGIDPEPESIALARGLIADSGLQDRCEARLLGVQDLIEESAYDVATSFLTVHSIAHRSKDAAFAAIARALRPGGWFVILDEAYPETAEALQTMPTRFAALAQWFELTWGNRIDTRTELIERCERAGLGIVDETAFSRFTILAATKP